MTHKTLHGHRFKLTSQPVPDCNEHHKMIL